MERALTLDVDRTHHTEVAVRHVERAIQILFAAMHHSRRRLTTVVQLSLS
jgi:hypothetical protein